MRNISPILRRGVSSALKRNLSLVGVLLDTANVDASTDIEMVTGEGSSLSYLDLPFTTPTVPEPSNSTIITALAVVTFASGRKVCSA